MLRIMAEWLLVALLILQWPTPLRHLWRVGLQERYQELRNAMTQWLYPQLPKAMLERWWE